MKNEHTLNMCGHCNTYEFETHDLTWRVCGVQKERETSRYLNRLDVLKELFNVFLNRAVGLCLIFCRGSGLISKTFVEFF